MNEHDGDLTSSEVVLLVDVVTGSCAIDEPRVRAAIAKPEFDAALRSATSIVRLLDAYRDGESAALAAPPSELDEIAVGIARRALGLPSRSRSPSLLRRQGPWWIGLVAALAVVWFALSNRAEPLPLPPPVHLGSQVGVQVDVAARSLRFEAAPSALLVDVIGVYEVQFGRGDAVLTTVPAIDATELALPDLSPYLPLEWVRVRLLEAGEERASSGKVPLPAELWR